MPTTAARTSREVQVFRVVLGMKGRLFFAPARASGLWCVEWASGRRLKPEEADGVQALYRPSGGGTWTWVSSPRLRKALSNPIVATVGAGAVLGRTPDTPAGAGACARSSSRGGRSPSVFTRLRSLGRVGPGTQERFGSFLRIWGERSLGDSQQSSCRSPGGGPLDHEE